MDIYYVGGLPCSAELYHHGILGQKWGVRRYQNLDGTLTAAGKERYGSRIQDYPKFKLRRQVGIVNDPLFGKPGKYAKTLDEYYKYSKKHSPWDDPKAVRDFVDKLAKAKLSDIGYTPSKEAIAYLKSMPWFNIPYAFLVDPSKKVQIFEEYYDEP